MPHYMMDCYNRMKGDTEAKLMGSVPIKGVESDEGAIKEAKGMRHTLLTAPTYFTVRSPGRRPFADRIVYDSRGDET